MTSVGPAATNSTTALGHHRLAVLGLGSVFVLAAILRLVALDSSLPQMLDPDSLSVVTAQKIEADGELDLARVSDLYPFFLARVLEALPGPLVVAAPPGSPVEEHLEAASRPHLLGRRLVACLALLAIPGTWLLARRHMSAGWATAAALLTGTSLLHLSLSIQARPHAVVTSFVLWGVVTARWMARRGTLLSVLACAGTTALALGTLHNGAAVLPAVAVASVAMLCEHGWRSLWKLVLFPLCAAVMVLYSTPFLLEGEMFAGRPFPESVWNGRGFVDLVQAMRLHDPVMGGAALIGLLYLAGRMRGCRQIWSNPEGRDLLIAAGFTLSFTLVHGSFYRAPPRFWTPLVPSFAALAAFGAASLTSSLSRRGPGPSRTVTVLVAFGLLALPTLSAGRQTWLRTRPNTTELAARWIEENLDVKKDVLALSYGLYLPLWQHSKTYPPPILRSPWQRYLREQGGQRDRKAPNRPDRWKLPTIWKDPDERADPRRFSLQEIQQTLLELSPNYALIRVRRGEIGRRDRTREAVLAAGAELIMEFAPVESAGAMGANGPSSATLRKAWTATHFGPKIEIYALPDQAPEGG